MAVNRPEPGRHDDGRTIARTVLAIVCVGAGVLMTALVLAMDRWLIG